MNAWGYWLSASVQYLDFTYKNERLKTHLKLYVIYMKRIEAVILSFNLKVHVTHMTR